MLPIDEHHPFSRVFVEFCLHRKRTIDKTESQAVLLEDLVDVIGIAVAVLVDLIYVRGGRSAVAFDLCNGRVERREKDSEECCGCHWWRLLVCLPLRAAAVRCWWLDREFALVPVEPVADIVLDTDKLFEINRGGRLFGC
uniref:Uncharacterized protein n=1 Tax=uncultured bacterium fosmid pJB16B1 TaxID=1478054 RepID=A0A0H3UA98_9BACT|nr:hypothetical protein [uncultured bacterium fosmid pJB16B1]